MANTFLRILNSNIGATTTSIGGYNVGAGVGAVVLSVSLSNQNPQAIIANVIINNGTTDFYLLRKAPILSGATIVPVGKPQKIILQTGDSIRVNASGNVAAYMSIMETDAVGLTTD
jgi:hypothetical protein